MDTPSLLRQVVREYTRAQRRAERCGDALTTVECHVLTELVRTESLTQQELADRLMLDKGWISRAVDRLDRTGLVQRTPDASDRRRLRLRLTPEGLARAGELDARLDAHAASLFTRLTPEQERALAGALAQVLANLQAGRAAQMPGTHQALRYRRATAADWPAIEALLRAAALPTEDAAHHLERFTVGENAHGVVAAGAFECYGKLALLRSFVIADEVRGQGHGSVLLRQVLADAAAAGVTRAYLLTRTAAPFFARHGFGTVARAEAPPAIRRTREFSELCPAGTALMSRALARA